jgi:methylphosphotriester-DNA--protein-cysteine methyltransferase
MDRRILILKEQILSNLKKQNSVEKMALSVDISASHLHRLFKAETGLSFGESQGIAGKQLQAYKRNSLRSRAP